MKPTMPRPPPPNPPPPPEELRLSSISLLSSPGVQSMLHSSHVSMLHSSHVTILQIGCTVGDSECFVIASCLQRYATLRKPMPKLQSELPRVLNASHATSIVVGIIIGSGIFLVPREMMAAVGSSLGGDGVWNV